MDGILNFNKPSGITSFAAVADIKRIMHASKAGHGGTLDPLAGGVLPVFIGKATRLSEYLMELHKKYRAEIELGVSTDSYDAEGKITARADISGINLSDLTVVLEKFKGDIRQVPPMFSALKRGGQPLYKLARQGKSIEIESRPASIYLMDIVSFNPPLLTLDIECSKGTYIRSLAHEIGAALGCGAHMKSLLRTAYGQFDIESAITIEQLKESVSNDRMRDCLYPMDYVLNGWEKLTLSDDQAGSVCSGISIPLDIKSGVKRLRAYNGSDNFIAVLIYQEEIGLWQPQKVFRCVLKTDKEGG